MGDPPSFQEYAGAEIQNVLNVIAVAQENGNGSFRHASCVELRGQASVARPLKTRADRFKVAP